MARALTYISIGYKRGECGEWIYPKIETLQISSQSRLTKSYLFPSVFLECASISNSSSCLLPAVAVTLSIFESWVDADPTSEILKE